MFNNDQNFGDQNLGNQNNGNQNWGNQNLGYLNWGNQNRGNLNRGNQNDGNQNLGNQNLGYLNWGNQNRGNLNRGNQNDGNQNLGNQNLGYRNSGYQNDGYQNYGDRNYGDRNLGNQNLGNQNNGNQNNGSWNKTNLAFGHFNTIKPIFKMFNKECDILHNCKIPKWLNFDLLIDELEWIDIKDMTEQQKKDNPTYNITQGFLLVKKSQYKYDEVYQKSAQASWDKATHEDRMLTYELPNFDADVAQEIFGIDFKAYLEQHSDKKVDVKTDVTLDEIVVNGKRYKCID